MVIYIVASDNEDGDSFDEDTFLAALPVFIALGYGEDNSFKKAVKVYNAGVGSNIAIGPKKSFFELTYKF